MKGYPMVKRWYGVLVLLLIQGYSVQGQNNYKFNCLTLFDKIPALKTCENAYRYVTTKGTPYQDFMKAKDRIQKTVDELSALQAAANQAMVGGGKSMMNPADARAIKDKLKNMSAEEKKQWAMQNAKDFMPAQAAHVNQDMNNKIVTEVVQYLAELEQREMEMLDAQVKAGNRIAEIETKYKPLREAESKEHDWGQYIGEIGEVTPEMEKKWAQEHEAYRKHMSDLFTKEMNEKLDIYNTMVKSLVGKYSIAMKKIESTGYGDDAKEPVNRQRIIHNHRLIASHVMGALIPFEDLFAQYAENHRQLYDLEPIGRTTE